ncbi:MAG TPA: hypothetical protein VG965_02495 [Patescibacteria group bacterium]|nr:hypothetical protein [Patescibacteria group bacterium]
MTSNAVGKLPRLREVQLRLRSGDTPTFDDLEEAMKRVVEISTTKIMLTFEGPEGNVDLTIRNIGSAENPEWVLYGGLQSLDLSSFTRLPGIPDGEEAAQELLGK